MYFYATHKDKTSKKKFTYFTNELFFAVVSVWMESYWLKRKRGGRKQKANSRILYLERG